MSASLFHTPSHTAALGRPGAQAPSAKPIARGNTARPQSWLARLNGTADLWAGRARTRRELRRALHIHAALGRGGAVQDLGATAGELLWEARKPFWRG